MWSVFAFLADYILINHREHSVKSAFHGTIAGLIVKGRPGPIAA
jgi:hypothetical protein